MTFNFFWKGNISNVTEYFDARSTERFKTFDHFHFIVKCTLSIMDDDAKGRRVGSVVNSVRLWRLKSNEKLSSSTPTLTPSCCCRWKLQLQLQGHRITLHSEQMTRQTNMSLSFVLRYLKFKYLVIHLHIFEH